MSFLSTIQERILFIMSFSSKKYFLLEFSNPDFLESFQYFGNVLSFLFLNHSKTGVYNNNSLLTLRFHSQRLFAYFSQTTTLFSSPRTLDVLYFSPKRLFLFLLRLWLFFISLHTKALVSYSFQTTVVFHAHTMAAFYVFPVNGFLVSIWEQLILKFSSSNSRSILVLKKRMFFHFSSQNNCFLYPPSQQ